MVGYSSGHDQRFYAKRLVFLITSIFILLAAWAASFSGTTYGVTKANFAKCLIEVSSGRVLYGENMDVRLPMASTTKAMTALLAVESGRLSETVTVPKQCAGIEGSSIYLREGDKISLEALTYGLMLRSGNDAAETIAVFLAGSIENFAEIMNRRADSLGLKNTCFVNPHGLQDENHYTSAYDLAIISAEGIKNQKYRQIVSTKSITFEENGKKWQFVNKNKLLFQYDGSIGVKTGYTKKAGRCLIAASERNGMAVVSVVLNVAPMFEECTRLMNLAHEQYKMSTIVKAGEVVCGVPIVGVKYQKAALTVKSDLAYPLKKDGSEKLEILKSTITEIPNLFDYNSEVGKIEVSLNKRLLFSENLYIMK